MAKKKVPEGAAQHVTAGPYSPVLEVEGGTIVVISGQVAVDRDGNVVGNTIKEQTEYTIRNCEAQLKSAGCSLADIFKVNIFMTDLAMWEDMNEVYSEMIPDPKPVRTAVQVGLLPGYLVEIEMWAMK